MKYKDDNFLHIVDICGNSSDVSLNYPRNFSGTEILISFDIEAHDFQIEIDWKCSFVKDFSINECIVDEDFLVENKFLKMKDHFQEFSISCLLTSSALYRTEGCQTYEIIRNNDDSLWYLTPDDPLVRISILKSDILPTVEHLFEILCKSFQTKNSVFKTTTSNLDVVVDTLHTIHFVSILEIE